MKINNDFIKTIIMIICITFLVFLLMFTTSWFEVSTKGKDFRWSKKYRLQQENLLPINDYP